MNISLVLVVLTLLSACRDNASSSIKDAEVPSPLSSAPIGGLEWAIDSVPLLLLSDDAEPGGGGFLNPLVLRRRDGTLLVANRSVLGIRAYSDRGDLLWTFGRKGAGPGEFRAISSMHLMAGDSLFIYDASLRRGTILGPSGEVGRMMALDPAVSFLGILSDSRMLVDLRSDQWAPRGSDQVVVTTRLLATASLQNGRVISILREFPLAEFAVSARGYTPVVFGRSGKIAIGPGRFALGFDAEPAVTVFTSSGTPVVNARWVQEPILVRDQDVRRQLAAQREEARLRGVRIGERSVSGVRLAPPPPVAADTFPFFRRLRMDPQHYLWVELYAHGETMSLWLVFDSVGVWTTSASMPAGFTLLQVGEDFLAGTLTREDVPLPAVLRLSRVPRPPLAANR